MPDLVRSQSIPRVLDTSGGLDKGISIRPYLSDDQIKMIDVLQKVDIGLLVAVPDFEQRKRHLEWYKMKLLENAA